MKSHDDESNSKGLRYDQVREAENRRYLTELINYRRPPDVQKRLLEVLKYEPQVTKKIDIVERLDRLGADTLGWYEDRIKLVKSAEKKQAVEKKRKSAYFFESPEYRALSAESKIILRELQPPSFFSFVSREFRRISQFGKREGLLRSSVLKLRHEPDRNLIFWCNEEMKSLVYVLESTLKRIGEHGWVSLDIRSYNSLVRFGSLVESWLKELPRLSPATNSRLLWLKLAPLARIWFSLTQAPEQTALILDGMAEFLKASGADGPEIRRQLGAAESILNNDRPGIGFGKALQAIWMLLARRFVSLQGLADLLKPEPIPGDRWDAGPEVLEAIETYVKARRGERDELANQIQLLKGLKILNPDEMESRALTVGWALYSESLDERVERGPEQASRHAIMSDLSGFGEKASANLAYVLNVFLRDRLVSEHSLSLELGKLETHLAALRQLRQLRERLVITGSDYQAWLGKESLGAGFSTAELEFAQALSEIGLVAGQLGLKLQQNINQTRELSTLAGSTTHQAAGFLADFEHELRDPPVFFGKNFGQALDWLQDWGFALAWILGSSEIRALAKRRMEIEIELAGLDLILDRMEGPK